MRLLALPLLIVFASSALAQTPEQIAAYLDSSKERQKTQAVEAGKRVEKMESDLEAMERGKVARQRSPVAVRNGRRVVYTYSSPLAKERAILAARQSLDAARAQLKALLDGAHFAPFGGIPKIGDIGKIANGGAVSVRQVVDRHNAIVTISALAPYTKTVGRRVVRDYRPITETVWLDGIDTSRMIGGRGAMVDGVFFAAGTKRYETAFGANTIMRLVDVSGRVGLKPTNKTPAASPAGIGTGRP